MHTTKSSIADGAYDNDVEALSQVRRLTDSLPQSNTSGRSRDRMLPVGDRYRHVAGYAGASQCQQALRHQGTDPEDGGRGRFLRDPGEFRQNIVCGFGRIEGSTVGFVANQLMVLAGVLDSDASRKAARFVRFCDCFNIPIVTFVDVPGFLPGRRRSMAG